MDVYIQFDKTPLLFHRPKEIVSCSDPAHFNGAFAHIESALRRGYYAAGFFSYEAGYSFEEKFHEDRVRDFPLIHFGIYDKPIRRKLIPAQMSRPAVRDLRLNMSFEEYSSGIKEIRRHISCGDVYQITYCIKLHFSYHGSPEALYHLLLRGQPVPYPAYIKTDRFHILSLSPEKFIRKCGRRVVTKPMKGTWPRGSTPLKDICNRLALHFDEKNRAENIMIADLLRNDLGRIGASVRAPKLFEVAGYRTLYQMTSTVTADVEKDISLRALFGALFPSGSVTGAPKIRAMEIIRSLEREERKIYTGAIGYITPGRDLFFNIPIRTLLLEEGCGEMGIGGGIVWDSTPRGEWDEGLLKASFLTDLSDPSFKYRSTMAK